MHLRIRWCRGLLEQRLSPNSSGGELLRARWLTKVLEPLSELALDQQRHAIVLTLHLVGLDGAVDRDLAWGGLSQMLRCARNSVML